MKLREYRLDACARAATVIENVTPANVIIEVAMASSIPRDPSAPAPNNRDQRLSQQPTGGWWAEGGLRLGPDVSMTLRPLLLLD